MGRAHEVRAKTIAKTNAAKSALYNRASKEIYLAAKAGVPDPKDNLALRAAVEKWKAQHVTRDVIDRAIAKAKSKDATAFVAGRYEGFGPGSVAIMVDTLSDNEKRAYAAVRAVFTHKGGNIGNSGCAAFNFSYKGVIAFNSDKEVSEVEELLIMSEVDVQSVEKEDGAFYITVTPDDLDKARDVLVENYNIQEFDSMEKTYVPEQYVELSDEDKVKVQGFIDALDELEDVQAVYHNGNL